jgi:hypothetical protein
MATRRTGRSRLMIGGHAPEMSFALAPLRRLAVAPGRQRSSAAGAGSRAGSLAEIGLLVGYFEGARPPCSGGWRHPGQRPCARARPCIEALHSRPQRGPRHQTTRRECRALRALGSPPTRGRNWRTATRRVPPTTAPPRRGRGRRSGWGEARRPARGPARRATVLDGPAAGGRRAVGRLGDSRRGRGSCSTPTPRRRKAGRRRLSRPGLGPRSGRGCNRPDRRKRRHRERVADRHSEQRPPRRPRGSPTLAA